MAPSSALAQHPEDVTELLERLPAGLADQGGLLGGGRVGQRHLQRPGVQDHQADPVGDHVVHLPGDAGPLLGPGPLGVEQLLPLQALGLAAQVPDQRPADPDPQAEQDRHPDDQHRHHDGEQGATSETTSIRASTTRASAPTSTPNQRGRRGNAEIV